MSLSDLVYQEIERWHRSNIGQSAKYGNAIQAYVSTKYQADQYQAVGSIGMLLLKEEACNDSKFVRTQKYANCIY